MVRGAKLTKTTLPSSNNKQNEYLSIISPCFNRSHTTSLHIKHRHIFIEEINLFVEAGVLSMLCRHKNSSQVFTPPDCPAVLFIHSLTLGQARVLGHNWLFPFDNTEVQLITAREDFILYCMVLHDCIDI